jgi:hypothetical protein
VDGVVRDGAGDAAQIEARDARGAGKYVARDVDLRAGRAVPIARDEHGVTRAGHAADAVVLQGHAIGATEGVEDGLARIRDDVVAERDIRVGRVGVEMLPGDRESVEAHRPGGREGGVRGGTAAVDDRLHPAIAVQIAVGVVGAYAGIGAEEGERLVDPGREGPGARRDDDGVAIACGGDRRRNAEIAAIADEQEVMTRAIADLLDARQRVGPVRQPAVDLPARLAAERQGDRHRRRRGCWCPPSCRNRLPYRFRHYP